MNKATNVLRMFVYWPSPLQVATTCAPDIASVRFAGSVNPVAVSLDALKDSDFCDAEVLSSFLIHESWLHVSQSCEVTGSAGHVSWLRRLSASDEPLDVTGVSNAFSSCYSTSQTFNLVM